MRAYCHCPSLEKTIMDSPLRVQDKHSRNKLTETMLAKRSGINKMSLVKAKRLKKI